MDLNAWKKGAIIGGLWGLMSIIPMIYCAFSDHCNTNYPPLSLKIISFPVYLTNKMILPKLGLIGVLIPIFIGALIGSIIADAINKWKAKSN